MKTLYEEIMKTGKSYSDTAEKLISSMDKAEIIHIQNVADYWFELYDGNEDKNWFDLFPNVAPPFPDFWLEYVFPQKVFLMGTLRENPFAGIKIGFLFHSELVPENSDGVKWQTEIAELKQTDKDYCRYSHFHMGIKADGQILSYGDGMALFADDVNNMEELPRYFVFGILGCALLAVSFLHCKNVEMVTRDSNKVPGKRAKRNQSRITYHTLQIEPMKKILRKEGQSETTGIKHALHICRGHFKDFSKGKGLFGRYQGLYWWDSQVRGNSKHGITMKDYDVKV